MTTSSGERRPITLAARAVNNGLACEVVLAGAATGLMRREVRPVRLEETNAQLRETDEMLIEVAAGAQLVTC